MDRLLDLPSGAKAGLVECEPEALECGDVDEDGSLPEPEAQEG